ncbi:MAG: cell division protein ZipA [Halioglobus sp.]|jgi:cell division protein ZipA
MDLTIRDWMVVIGVLLILVVLFDAWRRIRNDKYSKVNVDLVDPDTLVPTEADDLAWYRELPNGGARVIERGDILRAAGRHDASNQQTSRPDDSLVTGMSSVGSSDEPRNIDWLDGVNSNGEPSPHTTAGTLSQDEDPEVFMLNVVARSEEGFRGEDILHILLACDLRFGEMSFFHRHELEAGRGAIQFSVANMMQPGVFDIDNMSDMNTPGLVFFLTLPGPEDMMKAFDYMLETAQAVARNLSGDVLDESRSVLTKQTMDHCRQQIRDLERRLLAKAR